MEDFSCFFRSARVLDAFAGDVVVFLLKFHPDEVTPLVYRGDAGRPASREWIEYNAPRRNNLNEGFHQRRRLSRDVKFIGLPYVILVASRKDFVVLIYACSLRPPKDILALMAEVSLMGCARSRPFVPDKQPLPRNPTNLHHIGRCRELSPI